MLMLQSIVVPGYSGDGMSVGSPASELSGQALELSFNNNSDKSSQEESNISCNNSLQ